MDLLNIPIKSVQTTEVRGEESFLLQPVYRHDSNSVSPRAVAAIRKRPLSGHFSHVEKQYVLNGDQPAEGGASLSVVGTRIFRNVYATEYSIGSEILPP